MSRIGSTVVLAAVLAVSAAAGVAEASRAAEGGRGLPPMLEADASDLRLFPAVVSRLDPQVLAENTTYNYSYHGDPEAGDELGLLLGGRRFRTGYLLDNASHNIVIGGPGGWGAMLGFQDEYGRVEEFHSIDNDSYYRTDTEAWERTFRLAVGLRHVTAGDRLVEAGLAGSLIQGERDYERRGLQDGNPEASSLRWKSDGGLGVEAALRTLSAGGGLQAAVLYRYADLRPALDDLPLEPRLIRRYGEANLGWRLSIDPLDDVMAGVILAWSKVDETTFDEYGSGRIEEDGTTRYAGAVFLSVEERVRRDLVVRGGIRGPATFDIEESRTYRRDGLEWVEGDMRRTSQGATQTPAFHLGAGWTWRKLTLDVRFDDEIDLSKPFFRWAASWTF